MRDENVPVLPKHVERDPDKLRLLEKWKQTLHSRHTVAAFQDGQSLAVQVAADLGFVLVETRQLPEISRAKGVPEEPLRAVLKELGETDVPEAEIPDRLAKAADELIRLRADLVRLRNDRAAIGARASTLIDRGELDAARAALNEIDRNIELRAYQISRDRAIRELLQNPGFIKEVVANPDLGQIEEDWRLAETGFATDVIEGSISFVQNIAPESYWRLQDVWLEDVKLFKAYLFWKQSGADWSLDLGKGYYDEACRWLQERLDDGALKASASDFADAR